MAGRPTPDDQRLAQLHRRLAEVLREQEADTLMELLLPARWDLTALRNGVPRPASA